MRIPKTKRFGKGAGSPLRVLLVAPRDPENFWSMEGTARLMGVKALMPNAALPTLMALTPDDVDVEYTLVDENVRPMNLDAEADLVAITGAKIHAARIHELLRELEARGRRTAVGGPYATLEPDRLEGLCDHLFRGEAEHTWPRFLRDLSSGRAAAVYHQEEFIDLADSPPPDWSLVDPRNYVNFPVQTSRGCPNGCDFCDVVSYVGRRYRTKPAENILEELKRAHARGASTIFFSDDNFLGNKRFTKELLSLVLEWNCKVDKPLSFSTQITVKVADDEELLKLMADVRFSVLFLGVETVRKDNLAEVSKPADLGRNLHERIRRIGSYGIVPFIGLIVGFDNDDPGVFDDLRDFLDETGSPVVGISLLNAPRHTPLYERMKAEGRLVEGDFSGEWQLFSNIVPKLMTREELGRRYWEFFKECYRPEVFERRLEKWMDGVAYFPKEYEGKAADVWMALKGIGVFYRLMTKDGRDARKLYLRLMERTWKTRPRYMRWLFVIFTQYSHFYGFVNKRREG